MIERCRGSNRCQKCIPGCEPVRSLLAKQSIQTIHITDGPPEQPGERLDAEYSTVTPAYFGHDANSVLRGRGVGASDGRRRASKSW